MTSSAKQSRGGVHRLLDCFVASLLAMTRHGIGLTSSFSSATGLWVRGLAARSRGGTLVILARGGAAVLGDATGADHLDMVVHQRPRAARVAQLDQVGELAVHVENMASELRRGGDVAARPRHVLERNELHDENAVVRGLGHREMKVARQPGEFVEIADRS